MKAATRDNVRKVYSFRSSTQNTIYETVVWPDGSISCNCSGWCIKKKDKPRHCKHIDMVTGRRPMENQFDVSRYIDDKVSTARPRTRRQPVEREVEVLRHMERSGK